MRTGKGVERERERRRRNLEKVENVIREKEKRKMRDRKFGREKGRNEQR